jgi:hypothetical protein
MPKSFTDWLYDISVDGLFYLAHMTGFTYREINVIVFCIIIPLVIFVLIAIAIKQHITINHLKSISYEDYQTFN